MIQALVLGPSSALVSQGLALAIASSKGQTFKEFVTLAFTLTCGMTLFFIVKAIIEMKQRRKAKKAAQLRIASFESAPLKGTSDE